jgi:hypothetical protein
MIAQKCALNQFGRFSDFGFEGHEKTNSVDRIVDALADRHDADGCARVARFQLENSILK